MNAQYSAVERLLHRLALGDLTLQKSLADLESRLYAGLLRGVDAARPLFVTSLPRAGTTLLLDLIGATGAFAAQTYRDMPFVLCPLLWQAVTRGFRRPAELRERAHGDGMAVGYDSPEAFEEVIWKAFWPQKYLADAILPWSRRDREPEFEEAFSNHLRKVVAMRPRGDAGEGRWGTRYVSKNNANIARLGLLAEIFPDCTILIPFRNPGDHAASLARQHANFLARHDEDRFARSYMEWLGHYEFGRAFRPIAFPGGKATAASDGDFWLGYWDRAFRHVLADLPPQAKLIDYDVLCECPQPGLSRLSELLELPAGTLECQAGRIRRAERYPAPDESPLWPGAQDTYAALLRQAARMR
jgi:hypothetical protein